MATTADQARQHALSLPDAAESPHFEMTSFRVRGKIFATMPPDGEHLHVFVDPARVEELIDQHPDEILELRWGSKVVGARVHLPAASAKLAAALLTESWRRKAPKRLVEAFDERRPS